MASDLLVCSCDRTRTYNLPVNSRLLCQLSYAGMLAGEPTVGASVGYRTGQRRPRPSRRYSTATERGDNVGCRGYTQLQIRTDPSATQAIRPVDRRPTSEERACDTRPLSSSELPRATSSAHAPDGSATSRSSGSPRRSKRTPQFSRPQTRCRRRLCNSATGPAALCRRRPVQWATISSAR